MNGHVIRGTPIAVDFWKIRKCPEARLFFLTHFHSDHTVGLSSSWNQPIYCSKLTGDLICKKYCIPKELIHPMELDTPIVVPLDSTYSETITAVAIDANHCPGSVMFLFQGYFGCMLYTGDFRYEPKVIDDSYLSSLNCSIDTLYLDNTFCDPKCYFPTRNKAREWIMELISYYPTYDILFGMYNLGKPNLLVEIAQHFQEFIAVPSSMFEYFELIETPDVFQIDTKEHECRFRVVPFYQISKKYLSNFTNPTIAILPTAIYEGLDACLYRNQDDIFVVPYSDHSSYSEIVEFVQRMRPKQVIPIVNANAKGPLNFSISHRADMSCFSDYLSNSPIKKYSLPHHLKLSTFENAVKENSLLSSDMKKATRKAVIKRPTAKGVVFNSPAKPVDENGQLDSIIGKENNVNAISRSRSPANMCNIDSNSKDVETSHTHTSNEEINKNPVCDVQGTFRKFPVVTTPEKNSQQIVYPENNSEIPNTSKEKSTENSSSLENQSGHLSNNTEVICSVSNQYLIENIHQKNKKDHQILTATFLKKISRTSTDSKGLLPMLELLDKNQPDMLNQQGNSNKNCAEENANETEEHVSESDEEQEEIEDFSASNSTASTVYGPKPVPINRNDGQNNNVSVKKRKLKPSIYQYLQQQFYKNSKRHKNVSKGVMEFSRMNERSNSQSQRLISNIVQQYRNRTEQRSSASNSYIDFISKTILSQNHQFYCLGIESYQNIIEKFVLRQRQLNLL